MSNVRIYRSGQPIRRAVAYREKEDAPMTIGQNSAFHERLTLLTEHFAPGAQSLDTGQLPLLRHPG